MNHKNIFHMLNSQIKAIQGRQHLIKPATPFKIVVDEQASLLVFMTKREYGEYLESRDIELCRY